MSIKRAFSKDTYTVARKVDIFQSGVTETSIEYKRGVGAIKPDNLTSMLTTSGNVGLLVNANLYTKQAFPSVHDAAQGSDSDYFMWTDIDYTARWYQAVGWRDWARNGKDSYQQILGTYDAEQLDPLLTRTQDLNFSEIDNMVAAIGSTSRVIDMKMWDITLPTLAEKPFKGGEVVHITPPITPPTTPVDPDPVVPDPVVPDPVVPDPVVPDPVVPDPVVPDPVVPDPVVVTPPPSQVQKYQYNLSGDSDYIGYNIFDSSNTNNYIGMQSGNLLKFKYLENSIFTGSGETVLSKEGNKYLGIPSFALDPADGQAGNPFEGNPYDNEPTGVPSGGAHGFSCEFKPDFSRGEVMYLVSGQTRMNSFLRQYDILEVTLTVDRKIRVRASGFYGGVQQNNIMDLQDVMSSAIIKENQINTFKIMYSNSLMQGYFWVNGVRSALGGMPETQASLSTIRSFGAYDTQTEYGYWSGYPNDVHPRAEYDGVIKNIRMIFNGWQSPLDTEFIERHYPVDETTGDKLTEVIQGDNGFLYKDHGTIDNDYTGLHGLRRNMSDADIQVVSTEKRYLVSGITSTDFNLYITPDGILSSDTPEVISTIKYGGQLVAINSYMVGSSNTLKEVEIAFSGAAKIAKFAADSDGQNLYQGVIADIYVKIGSQEVNWAINTKGSPKQDPTNGSLLAFGINTTNYSEDKWSLSTII